MAASLTTAQREKLKEVFDLYDSDGSGKISEKELGNVFKTLKIQVNDSELKQVVAEMDTNKSGQIEFDEFCKAMAATYLKNFNEDEIRSAFRLFDQDGSGYIQANELENIMNQMGKRYSKADINAMVKNFDSSGDGKISYEEFVKMFN